MANGIFVTGSGTGVGKTHVCKLLLNGFAKQCGRATYMKPVETGCDEFADGSLFIGADTRSVLGFTLCKADDLTLHAPYRFAPSCSPHLAAERGRREISIGHIVATYEKLSSATSADIILVEGAGGVLVPINGREYMADVIKALGIPAILVTTPALGTLNHTFLSLRVLEQYGIPVAGIIINNAGNISRNFIYEDNIKTIRRYAGSVPCQEIDYNDMISGTLLMELYDEIAVRA
ncbi:MAG: dethiobiotin synthase [Chitinispirillia bacterium]|nr:dethiobiotin synthase [Chitinispirillia bacterium]